MGTDSGDEEHPSTAHNPNNPTAPENHGKAFKTCFVHTNRRCHTPLMPNADVLSSAFWHEVRTAVSSGHSRRQPRRAQHPRAALVSGRGDRFEQSALANPSAEALQRPTSHKDKDPRPKSQSLTPTGHDDTTRLYAASPTTSPAAVALRRARRIATRITTG